MSEKPLEKVKLPKIKREGNYFRLFLGKKKIGFLHFCILSDESNDRNVELSYVEINQAHRGNGYGYILIKHFIEYFKDYTWLTLWTSKDLEKKGGWTIYKTLGFKQSCYLEDYYEPGVGTRMFSMRNAYDD